MPPNKESALFGSFFTFILIWVAAIPVAALIYNAVIVKEPVNMLHIFGILLIFAGSILILPTRKSLILLKLLGFVMLWA